MAGGCPTCDCSVPNTSGNDVYAIPVKIGSPLSTACERSKVIGSIPVVYNLPAFTLVNGGTVQNQTSNAGICNMSSFFKSRKSGCYQPWDSRLSGSVCC